MTTLVVCLDRTDDVGRKAGVETPVAGWEDVESLVSGVGLADPEDSGVNSILEALRVTQDIKADGGDAAVAVVSGTPESMVSADRSVARQLDALVDEYDPDSAIVVIDSAEDERLVPVVESRLPVDAVDRVVVRQARDLESTYYLLKQFLADEELRQTTLVPIGTALVVFPVLSYLGSFAMALATIVAVIGLFLVYKGFGLDENVEGMTTQAREAVYSGKISVVTYVVAAGLALVGVFAGVIGMSDLPGTEGILLPAMQFAYDSILWLAIAALTASTGRLLDEVMKNDEQLRTSYLNLPFVVVAIGLIIRGFAAYFLERGALLEPAMVPAITLGPVAIDALTLEAGERLALYVVSGVFVSLVGIKVASYLGGSQLRRDGEASTEP